MTTGKEELEAEIAERDARIAELEAIVPIESELRAKAEQATTELERELAALKAQQLSAGVACALMSALEGIVHDQRVPNEVSQECAAVLIEARRSNPNPARSGVVLPDLITELKKQADEIAREGHAGWGNTMLLAAEALSVAGVALPERMPRSSDIYAIAQHNAGWNSALDEIARLNPCRAQAAPEGLTFNALRAANAERIGSSKYRKCEENWTPAHWMQATVGELGELANLLKKVDRGDFLFEQVKGDVAKELADVQTYLDILALKLGVDLGQATIEKFNEVSARIGSHVLLAAATSANSEQARSCVTCNGVGIIGHSTICPECTIPSTQQKESGDE